MVDRIKVRLDFPLIDPENSLKFTPMATVNENPTGSFLQLRYIDGTTKMVSRLSYEVKDICKVDSYNGHIYAEFNFPKLKSGGRHNIWPVTQAEARTFVNELTQHLAKAGLVSNLNKSTVINLELFADAATKYSFNTFRPLFEILDLPRTSLAAFDSSYTLYNSQRADSFYDKRAQLPRDVAQELPPYYIRYEYRLHTDDAVEAEFGTKILGEIIDRWDLLHEKYIARVRKVLFGNNPPTEPLFGNLDQLIGQKKRQDVLPSLGALGFLRQFGSISTIKSELRRQGYKAYEVRHFIRKLQKYLAKNHTEVGLGDLRTELFNKLVEGLARMISNNNLV